MLRDFNLLATTARGCERQMVYELLYLLRDALSDSSAEASKTGVRGLVTAKTSLDPLYVIEKFRAILHERSYEFRYALRVIPIQRTTITDLEHIGKVARELAIGIRENESFRVTVEKRFTELHATDLVEAAAGDVQRKVDLDNPSKILLIEVLGKQTGLSLLEPNGILNVLKEKML